MQTEKDTSLLRMRNTSILKIFSEMPIFIFWPEITLLTKYWPGETYLFNNKSKHNIWPSIFPFPKSI